MTAAQATAPATAWRPSSRDRRSASARIRGFNLVEHLAAAGQPVSLYDAGRERDYRVIVYSKLFGEEAIADAQRQRAAGTRIVFDICDNYFEGVAETPVIAAARARMLRMIALAHRVTSASDALAEVVTRASGRRVQVVGDALEPDAPATRGIRGWLARRRLAALERGIARSRAAGRAQLVWFGIHAGSSGGGMRDLGRIREVLERHDRRWPLALTVVSDSRATWRAVTAGWGIPTRYLPWDLATATHALRAHDIAVIPIAVDAFTRCKSANRLAQALDAGLAVVADAIPSYREFAPVTRLDAWESGLADYLGDAQLRRGDAERGRALVRERCGLAPICARWIGILRQAVDGPQTD